MAKVAGGDPMTTVEEVGAEAAFSLTMVFSLLSYTKTPMENWLMTTALCLGSKPCGIARSGNA